MQKVNQSKHKSRNCQDWILGTPFPWIPSSVQAWQVTYAAVSYLIPLLYNKGTVGAKIVSDSPVQSKAETLARPAMTPMMMRVAIIFTGGRIFEGRSVACHSLWKQLLQLVCFLIIYILSRNSLKYIRGCRKLKKWYVWLKWLTWHLTIKAT